MTPAEQAREALEKILSVVAVPKHKLDDTEFLRASCHIAATTAQAALSALAPAADELRLAVRWDELGNLFQTKEDNVGCVVQHGNKWFAVLCCEPFWVKEFDTRAAACEALVQKIGGGM